jgi:FeS assembly SUF system protein
MSDEPNKPEPTHLTVLPHSGKVDQLRQEHAMSKTDPTPPAAQSAATPKPTHQHLPATPAYKGHKNRISPIPEQLKTVEYKALEGKIIAALMTVFDPEIPVNIYDLGLIYDIEIDPENNVHVRMTLTAPGCPVAGSLPGEVEKRIEAIPEVKSATVDLVWDPPWDRDMMSETAMLTLGMF